MEFSALQIAEMLGGSIEGNENITVTRLAKIEEGVTGSLTFLANEKYEPYIYSTGASLAIVSRDFAPDQPLPSTLTLLRVSDPYAAFTILLEAYDTHKRSISGIEPSAIIDPKASIGQHVYLGHNAVIMTNAQIGDHTVINAGSYIGLNVQIGAHCLIHPGVRILDDCIIGNHCTLHAGAIVGSDGFGFAPDAANNYKKVPQIGNVVIEDHVEIGANTCIDRATIGSTVIRKGVKLDNLIQVAHNVEIGENTVIAAQTGIAGSTKIGKNCMIGGQVGIVGHITIADGVRIAAQSGIGSSITKEGSTVQGSPALDIRGYKMSYVLFKNLPKLEDRLRSLEKRADADLNGSSHD